MKKPLLMLFDGNALLHRAFHALPPLTVRKTGETVGAVYGFALMLLKALSELNPSHCAVAFDLKAPTFRHQLFRDYKAHRPPTPDELVNQLGRVRELVSAFNIPIFELEGYEADDVLGTLSREASEQGIDSVIVTGDADTMQLVSPKTRVLYPKPRGSFSDTNLYDEATVKERYGVAPEHIADLKGLVGDPSDNIPGIPGVGNKTAVKLIGQFGSVEEIYAQLDQVSPPKLQALLRQHEETARQSKHLATIVTGVPLSFKLDSCQLSLYDRKQVAELFRELEFFSLLTKLPEAEAPSEASSTSPEVKVTPQVEPAYHTVNTAPDFDGLLARLKDARSFVFDLETTSLDAMQAQLVGISLSLMPGEAYYLPVGHIGLGQPEQLPLETGVNGLKPLFEDASLAKLAHNGKYDMTVLAGYGVAVANLAFDTMIAAYLLNEKSLGLKALAFSRLGIEMTPITDLIGSGAKQRPMSQVSVAEAAAYAGADADITGRLKELLEPELREQGLWRLFAEVEMPLVPILVAMERNGVALDTGLLRQMAHRLGEQLINLEKEIYGNVGHQFNINSPQQLGSVLFQELGLPPARKTKSGYATGAAILEELRGVHPVIELILSYRQLSKLKSTYIDALPALVNPKTGRVHTSFNQTRTATGRLSSSEPNLQNIPVRGGMAKEIREAFISPPGTFLLAGDYSQIDLRALAHLSQDPGLVSAFRQDADIHTATAAQLFNVKPAQVTPDMRRLAKTVNFGVIYGMSDYGLEQATELSRKEAAQFIAAYFEKYPGLKAYLETTKAEARRSGYVQTILGRRRHIPEINAANRQIREAAERMAINMPVQGTSADIIKIAMINLHREMERRKLGSKMLLQVHDELIFEVPQEEMELMRKLVPEIMSTALALSVPLKVDIKTGANWGEMEPS
ncbi:MAG: DNA polymerase I [Dehalococcoidales bacterium]|nr:DNA polymerase I [Dehalococcoidales bacterium]